MTKELQQNAVIEPFLILMVDSANHITGKTGLTLTVTIRKNGDSFAAPQGAVSEIGYGWYMVAPHASDRNTLGPLLLHAEGAGADPFDREYSIVEHNPLALDPVGVNSFSDDAEAELQSIISDAIASLRGSVESPYLQRGKILRIVAGDDYIHGVTRSIPWSLEDAGSLVDLTGWTPELAIIVNDTAFVLDDGNVSVATGSTRSGYIEATAAETALITPGDGTAQLRFRKDGKCLTPLEALAKVSRNHATA